MTNLIENKKLLLFPQEEIPFSHNSGDDGSSTQNSLISIMRAVVVLKSEKKFDIERKRNSSVKERYSFRVNNDWRPVGIDLFYMCASLFQYVQECSATIVVSTVGHLISTCCGFVGGVINLAVGIASLVRGIKIVRKGEKLCGMYHIAVGVLMIVVGIIMIATPIVLKFVTITILVAIVHNPLVLLISSLLLAAFFCYSLGKTFFPILSICLGKDWATRFKEQIEKEEDLTQKITELWGFLPTEIIDKQTNVKQTYSFTDITTLIKEGEYKTLKTVLSTQMDSLEQQEGIDVALQVYQLMITLLELDIAQKEKQYLMQTLMNCENDLHKYCVLNVADCECFTSQSHPPVEEDSFVILEGGASLQNALCLRQKKPEYETLIQDTWQKLWIVEEQMKSSEYEDQKLAFQRSVDKKHKIQVVIWLCALFSVILNIVSCISGYMGSASRCVCGGTIILNFVSLCINTLFPFSRGMSVVVPKIDEKDIDEQLCKQKYSGLEEKPFHPLSKGVQVA